MDGERTYIYAWRASYLLKSVITFLFVAAVSGLYFYQTTALATKLISGAIGAFFLFLSLAAIGGMVTRGRGRRTIIVGEKTLTLPSNIVAKSPIVEIPYSEIRDVTLGSKSLQIHHGDKKKQIEILRTVIGSDAELDEMTKLIKERVRAHGQSQT